MGMAFRWAGREPVRRTKERAPTGISDASMNQQFSLFLSRVVASLLAMVLALSAMGAFLVWVARSVDNEDIGRQGEIAGYALRGNSRQPRA